MSYNNFCFIGLQMNETYMTANKSKIKGLYFRYSFTHSGPQGRLIVNIPSKKVTDYDDFHYVCPATGGEWHYMQFRWKDCKQAGWGQPVDKLLTEDIKELQFRIEAEGIGEIRIDNVAFVNDSGDAVVPILFDSPHSPGKPPVKIQPNYDRGRIVFIWEGRKGAGVRLQIFSLKGQLVHSRASLFLKRNRYVWQYRSDDQTISAGLYMLVATAGKAVYARKFSIVK